MTSWKIINGDSLEILKTYPDNHFDSTVQDPPAAVSMMNMEWDSDKGGRDQWIAWLQSIMVEVYRTLKPGAWGLVWSLPRTSHYTAMACELAGFNIKDTISAVVGKGFPKSHNISKAIDKLKGVEPTVVGSQKLGGNACVSLADKKGTYGVQIGVAPSQDIPITKGTSPEAIQWEGWGTALSPKKETWILIQKPVGEKSIARNVLKHGVGGINIDACRVGGELTEDLTRWKSADGAVYGTRSSGHNNPPHEDGRWPSNFVMVHSPECQSAGTVYEESVVNQFENGAKPWGDAVGQSYKTVQRSLKNDKCLCVPWCPVLLLNNQVADGAYNIQSDNGLHVPNDGPSRFFNTFYYSKASTKERNLGLEGQFAIGTVNDGRDTPIDNPYQRGKTEKLNVHPTVKALSLMSWLCKLVTPKGGTVLDPFAGSGSTGCAAVQCGFNFVGIEKDPEYVRLAEARISHYERKGIMHELVEESEKLGMYDF